MNNKCSLEEFTKVVDRLRNSISYNHREYIIFHNAVDTPELKMIMEYLSTHEEYIIYNCNIEMKNDHSFNTYMHYTYSYLNQDANHFAVINNFSTSGILSLLLIEIIYLNYLRDKYENSK